MNEAAKVLGVSQASLSSALKELEDEFGVHIFDRSNKGVKITRDGAEFIRYARQLISQYEVIIDRYDNGNKKSVRNFAVTSQHYDFAAEAFVKFMSRFSGDYNLSLKEAKTAEVIRGRCEYALRHRYSRVSQGVGRGLHGEISSPQRTGISRAS